MNNSGEEQKAHLIMKLRGQGIRSSKILSAIETLRVAIGGAIRIGT